MKSEGCSAEGFTEPTREDDHRKIPKISPSPKSESHFLEYAYHVDNANQLVNPKHKCKHCDTQFDSGNKLHKHIRSGCTGRCSETSEAEAGFKHCRIKTVMLVAYRLADKSSIRAYQPNCRDCNSFLSYGYKQHGLTTNL